MISDSGRLIAAELYDRLDPAFRESSIKSAAKYISLSKSNATISSKIIELADIMKAHWEKGMAHLPKDAGEILTVDPNGK